MPRFTRLQNKKNSDQPSQGTESTPFLRPTSCLPTNPSFLFSEDNLEQTLPETAMPRFTRLRKKKNSNQSSQRTESTHFLRPTPYLPTNPSTSFQFPSIQATLQPSRSIHLASHSALMDQATSQLALTVHLEFNPALMDLATSQLAPTVNRTSHPSRPVHSISRPASTDQDSPQSSRSVYSTSHSASMDQDSTQPAPTVQDTSKKRSRRESATHWVVDAIGGSKANATRRAEIMAEIGQRPGRAQMYIATHKNKDGVCVNEGTKEICEKN